MGKPLLTHRELTQVMHVLRVWRDVRAALRLREQNALLCGYGTDFEPHGRSGGHGNPTQARALRLATDSTTRQLQRLNGALERALLIVGGQAGKDSPIPWAMRAHYLAGQTWDQVAKRLDVSRQTVWRWEMRFRVHVWEQLGRRL